jgi:hypothetical protein
MWAIAEAERRSAGRQYVTSPATYECSYGWYILTTHAVHSQVVAIASEAMHGASLIAPLQCHCAGHTNCTILHQYSAAGAAPFFPHHYKTTKHHILFCMYKVVTVPAHSPRVSVPIGCTYKITQLSLPGASSTPHCLYVLQTLACANLPCTVAQCLHIEITSRCTETPTSAKSPLSVPSNACCSACTLVGHFPKHIAAVNSNLDGARCYAH